jgi:membrane protease YdiL (CAAX protease family)
MQKREPHSFILFTIVVSVIALVFTAAVIFSKYNANKNYAVVLVFILLLMFALAAVGIYAGKQYTTDVKKYKRQNNIGFIGNLVVFIVMLGLMIWATVMR